MTRRIRLRLVGAGLLSAGLLTGCGSQPAPAEAAPAVAGALTRLDEAVAQGRYGVARTALADLVRATIEARRSERLTTEQADRILAAATRVESSLPAPAPKQPVTDGTDDRRGQGHGEEERSDRGEEERGGDEDDDEGEERED